MNVLLLPGNYWCGSRDSEEELLSLDSKWETQQNP